MYRTLHEITQLTGVPEHILKEWASTGCIQATRNTSKHDWIINDNDPSILQLKRNHGNTISNTTTSATRDTTPDNNTGTQPPATIEQHYTSIIAQQETLIKQQSQLITQLLNTISTITQ